MDNAQQQIEINELSMKNEIQMYDSRRRRANEIKCKGKMFGIKEEGVARFLQ